LVEIKFLGGCRQIGGSAVEIQSSDGKSVLCDFGIYMEKKHPKFPKTPSAKDLKYVVLSHCHADHSCGLPLLYGGRATPETIMTPVTKDLTALLIDDTLRISKDLLPFEREEMRRFLKNTRMLNYDHEISHKNTKLTLLDAGHIPGSACILLEIDGKRILYTGDMNQTKTQLVMENFINNSHDLPPIDYLLIESTYALETHPPREETEKDFINEVKNVLENDGIVLCPAFGVARSQEILLVLNKYGINSNITIDGMARKSSRIIRDHPESVRDYDLFLSSLQKSKLISFNRRKREERMQALNRPGVIIAPSGMLKGGIVVLYLEHLYDDENAGIFVVSYQIEDSPGRILLDTGHFNSRSLEKNLKVEGRIRQFNFSSHSDRPLLMEFINSLDFTDDAKIFCMHGEENSCNEFAAFIEEEYKIQAFSPKVGDAFT